MTSEQLKVGSWRAGFNQIVLLIRLARMFTLARLNHVHLRPPRRERAHGASNAEQQQLGDVPKIKTHAATIWAEGVRIFV